MSARKGSFVDEWARQARKQGDGVSADDSNPASAWARAINDRDDDDDGQGDDVGSTDELAAKPDLRSLGRPEATRRASLFEQRYRQTEQTSESADAEPAPVDESQLGQSGHQNTQSAMARYGEAIEITPSELAPGAGLSVLHAPQSAAAKAYLALYSQVASSITPAHGIPAIAITSHDAQTGRTATAANLAALFARSGMQVVLIEADFKRPNMLSLFGVPNMSGLGDWVCGRNSLSGVVFDELPGLTLIPAGQSGPGLEEKLAHPGFRRWLQRLSAGRNSVVLIDTAPGESAIETESICVGAGHAILTCRRHTTRVGAAAEYVKRLRERGVNFVGASLLG